MRKLLIINVLILIVFLVACERKPSPPSDVIPKEKMIKLLVDIHKANAIMESMQVFDTLALDQSYYNHVFIKHNVKPSDFTHSLEWYMKHSEVYNDVYTEVVEDINQQDIELKKEVERRRQQSNQRK